MKVDMRAISVTAHAHYLGKEINATATFPDGSSKPLLWIKDWDFNWHDQYAFKDPVLLPKGTKIDVRITYDNSADNPQNPSNPPRRVQWGEESLRNGERAVSAGHREQGGRSGAPAGDGRSAQSRAVVGGPERRAEETDGGTREEAEGGRVIDRGD
jgi:hypothetical protein